MSLFEPVEPSRAGSSGCEEDVGTWDELGPGRGSLGRAAEESMTAFAASRGRFRGRSPNSKLSL